ncbi:uncharacterized protein LOC128247630 [Octopus bimaculoides]|uniref:uncharacterized protein LOC128247630 n=1 Tax=Octopus bimaculoides TaxID=37653 RepID=UPI0022E6B4E1|nr:uncharacterized protein LOC128247630 [Octopus bimaculoides]XP_052823430.1 uncharacterized protein LOC128247630 [Octopus bimaculoides]
MPCTKEAFEVPEFQRGRIMGHFESGHRQCKIAENLGLLLSIVNRVIAQFTREEESTSTRSAQPEPSDRTLLFVKRSVEANPRCKTFNLTVQVDVSPRTAVRYPHRLGYYGRAARRKSLLRPANTRRRKDWASEMVEKPVAFWNTVIFSDKFRFAAFPDNGRVWVWKLCDQEFNEKRLQSGMKHGNYSVMTWRAI